MRHMAGVQRSFLWCRRSAWSLGADLSTASQNPLGLFQVPEWVYTADEPFLRAFTNHGHADLDSVGGVVSI